ncbi:MAG: glycosyltransferase [Deltaproteobacteria bacterium]|nr:glycosyltransferase [Deltaproteobacteria bacterium]
MTFNYTLPNTEYRKPIVNAILETVSVICVCYNEEPNKIRATINSIIAQDYPNIEIIIIDGGSKPDTLDVFKEYQEQIDYMVSEEDRGIFDAMNKGIFRATGDWIIFMNIGDKFYDRHSLSGLMAGANRDVDILYGGISSDDLIVVPPLQVSKYTLYTRGICHQALLARRSLFFKVGQFNLAYIICGDPEWIIRAFKQGAAFKYMNVVVANYEGYGFSSNYHRRKYYWKMLLCEHFSRTEIIAYWLRWILERSIRRIVKLDFSIPTCIKRYFHKNRKDS